MTIYSSNTIYIIYMLYVDYKNTNYMYCMLVGHDKLISFAELFVLPATKDTHAK